MKKFIVTISALAAIGGAAASFAAQTKAPVKKNARAAAAPEATPETTPTPPGDAVKTPSKKNERPGAANGGAAAKAAADAPNYFYEFTQPAFTIPKIHIEHDDRGRGTISFVKSISSEEISDPIEISAAALARINDALAALDFFNSTASYQYEKDYSHLGNVLIRITRDGKTRETKYNWTQNPDAKTLADEYRKIANQYIWLFDINLSRVNQPLESPKLMDALDGYIKRNEISDPAQLVPFLKELGDDERIPLIARNHAARLVKQIEKPEK